MPSPLARLPWANQPPTNQHRNLPEGMTSGLEENAANSTYHLRHLPTGHDPGLPRAFLTPPPGHCLVTTRGQAIGAPPSGSSMSSSK